MDPDDATPPPIRRTSRHIEKLEKELASDWFRGHDTQDVPAHSSIARQRSSSLGSRHVRTPSIPPKSPARNAPVSTQPSGTSARNFSHPFRERLLPSPSPLRPVTENEPPVSQRPATQSQRPATQPLSNAPQRPPVQSQINGQLPLKSGRKRLVPRPLFTRSSSSVPRGLRRWSSLETIDSVDTRHAHGFEEDEETEETDSFSGRPSTDTATDSTLRSNDDEDLVYEGEEDTEATEDHSLRQYPSPSSSSRRSEDTTSDAAHTPTSKPSSQRSRKNSASSSLLRKMKSSKFQEPLILPQHLEISRTVEVDQSSLHRSSSSGSVPTISSGLPWDVFPRSEATSNRSVDSSEWKASDYDITGLSEKEVKKCLKRGVNPALYAEMKAARKGKWVSPIGGNTIL